MQALRQALAAAKRVADSAERVAQDERSRHAEAIAQQQAAHQSELAFLEAEVEEAQLRAATAEADRNSLATMLQQQQQQQQQQHRPSTPAAPATAPAIADLMLGDTDVPQLRLRLADAARQVQALKTVNDQLQSKMDSQRQQFEAAQADLMDSVSTYSSKQRYDDLVRSRSLAEALVKELQAEVATLKDDAVEAAKLQRRLDEYKASLQEEARRRMEAEIRADREATARRAMVESIARPMNEAAAAQRDKLQVEAQSLRRQMAAMQAEHNKEVTKLQRAASTAESAYAEEAAAAKRLRESMQALERDKVAALQRWESAHDHSRDVEQQLQASRSEAATLRRQHDVALAKLSASGGGRAAITALRLDDSTDSEHSGADVDGSVMLATPGRAGAGAGAGAGVRLGAAPASAQRVVNLSDDTVSAHHSSPAGASPPHVDAGDATITARAHVAESQLVDALTQQRQLRAAASAQAAVAEDQVARLNARVSALLEEAELHRGRTAAETAKRVKAQQELQKVQAQMTSWRTSGRFKARAALISVSCCFCLLEPHAGALTPHVSTQNRP